MLDRLKNTPSFFNSQRKRLSFSSSQESNSQNELPSHTSRQSKQIVINFLAEYLLLNCHQSFILALQYINLGQHQKHSTFFNKLIYDASPILQTTKQNTELELNDDQIHRLQSLVSSFQKKVNSYLAECVRQSNLLHMVKNSKLQAIAKTYQVIILPKNYSLSFPKDKCDKIHLYYLLCGEVQKLISFESSNQQQKPRKSQQYKTQNLKQRITNQKLKNIKVFLESSIKKQKNQRNELKTILQSRSFIGDQLFSALTQTRPQLTSFVVISEKAVVIKFDGDIVRNTLAEFYYLEESKQFYEQKSIIQTEKVKSMRIFDKKYKSLCRKREQDKLKRQLSPQMLEIKKGILKRYYTEEQHLLDSKSAKQISQLLFIKRKKIGMKSSNCELPVVEVFENHSEKRRSHQGSILSPLAIVKTRRNYKLLNKSENVKQKRQKSQIYQVKSWQSLKSVTDDGLSKEMKKVDSIVKRKQNALGGFHLLQINRKIQKIKKEGLKI